MDVLILFNYIFINSVCMNPWLVLLIHNLESYCKTNDNYDANISRTNTCNYEKVNLIHNAEYSSIPSPIRNLVVLNQ